MGEQRTQLSNVTWAGDMHDVGPERREGGLDPAIVPPEQRVKRQVVLEAKRGSTSPELQPLHGIVRHELCDIATVHAEKWQTAAAGIGLESAAQTGDAIGLGVRVPVKSATLAGQPLVIIG